MNPTLEITTKIGCKNMCEYCPQHKLISAYAKKGDIVMKFNTFKKCLNKVPKNVGIEFSGMSEPFLNPECNKMILYAQKEGYSISLYTTFQGVTLDSWKEIEVIPFKRIIVHLPEKGSKMIIDKVYLKLLNYIIKNLPKNLSFMVFGEMPENVKSIFPFTVDDQSKYLQSRAGNLVDVRNVPLEKRKRGIITCKSCSNNFNHNILLPNGDVVICCMDYSLKYILGNLVRDNYEDLFKSETFEKLREGLKDDSKEILCRYCRFSENILIYRIKKLFGLR